MNMTDLTILISIIMPAYNVSAFIEDSIDSVLNQTYTNWELIVVDDGSTDQTLSILKKYSGLVTVLQHPCGVNRGVSLSRKLGIDHAKGKYIAFLDADDFFEPDKIEIQVELLEGNPKVVLCHTAINQISGIETSFNCQSWFNFENKVVVYDYKKTQNYLMFNPICNSSVTIRSDIIKNIPFSGKQIYQFEDWLTWTLAAEFGDFLFTPRQLLNYRIHSESATSEVLENTLKKLYSFVEFYITLISRTSLTETRKKCLSLLIEKIDEIHVEYSNNDANLPKFAAISCLLKAYYQNNDNAFDEYANKKTSIKIKTRSIIHRICKMLSAAKVILFK